MLLEFSVKNYRSFRDKVTLSMVASSDKEHLDTNTFEVTTPSRFRLLKSAAIYGANASGKTNLYKAAVLMHGLVTRSATDLKPGDPLDVSRFQLDPATRDQPSEFEVSFIAGGERYVYGFAADRERVHEEWLTAARTSKSRPLFHRHPEGSVEWGNTWRGERERLRAATRPNALLLSVAAQYNSPTVVAARGWFADTIRFLSPSPEWLGEMDLTLRFLEADPTMEEALVRFLAVADLGITGVEEVTAPIDEARPGEALGEYFRRMAGWGRGRKGADDAWTLTRVRAHHRATDGSDVRLDMGDDESAGTLRLFATAGPWLGVLALGRVLFVDEFESKLHPLITRALLRMVHEAPTNPQVIFTTHDCSLLDADLLRRDQVWFTEKDEDGATDLYSLWDYKVRKDENYRMGYLHGRYGAIPFIGEFSFGEDTKA